MLIAIDGPAASGKGTIARRLAAHFGLGHMDTGALYRAVARDMIKSGVSLEDCVAAASAAHAIDIASLEDPGLRDNQVGEAASIVAGYPSVREALLERQRAFARRAGGAVLDGRDIGTVVCPDADVKLFVTASVAERAGRRHRELAELGHAVTLEEVRQRIEERDLRDRSRPQSPMIVAADALLLDTTKLDIEAAVAEAVRLVERSTSRPGRSIRP